MIPTDVLAIIMAALYLYIYAALKAMPGGNPILRRLPRLTLGASVLLVLIPLAIAYLEFIAGGSIALPLIFAGFFLLHVRGVYGEIKRL